MEFYNHKSRNTLDEKKLEEARKNSLLETSEGPANTLILDFWPPTKL